MLPILFSFERMIHVSTIRLNSAEMPFQRRAITLVMLAGTEVYKDPMTCPFYRCFRLVDSGKWIMITDTCTCYRPWL